MQTFLVNMKLSKLLLLISLLTISLCSSDKKSQLDFDVSLKQNPDWLKEACRKNLSYKPLVCFFKSVSRKTKPFPENKSLIKYFHLQAKESSLPSQIEINGQKKKNCSKLVFSENDPIFQSDKKTDIGIRNPNEKLLLHNEYLITQPHPELETVQKRTKRNSPSENEIEICATIIETGQLNTAMHAQTREAVTIHNENDSTSLYYQRFDKARCLTDFPTAGLTIFSRPAICREVHNKVLAFIRIPAARIVTGQYRRCSPRPGSNEFVCRDWILVPAQCKLFVIE